jgi:DNA (cytosine-5)-methyltransferase 1
MLKPDTKPMYRVPLMSEIKEMPWNGFKVASTFSGCGGSCTGYRMAGFKVVWANEFVPSAQASYKANCASDSILDGRDIKLVHPSEILAATKLKVGELDIFDGSPPCQAFSTAGKREKGWGKNKQYEHGATQKNETLFDEYVRLLRGLKPKVFVAENVKGLVMGTAKGYFLEILAALKASGYRVTCRVLDAQWLGVPQQRQRTIFVGVRNDLNAEPVHPSPLPYRYSVEDAMPWIVDVRQSLYNGTDQRNARGKPCPTIGNNGLGASRPYQYQIEIITGNDKFKSIWGMPDVPNPTVLASGANKQGGFLRQGTEKRKFTIAELKRICAFPDDFVLLGSYAQQWERLGNSVPPLMMKAIAEVIRDKILSRQG